MGAGNTMLSHLPLKLADAKKPGANKFILTSDRSQLKSATIYSDSILGTVSADHYYNLYLRVLATNGVMVCAGAPSRSAQIPAFNLIFGGSTFAGSLVGGIPETQEMLDYCTRPCIVSDVELIKMSDINEPYERRLKDDVIYRFVGDIVGL